jgi:hypothetical protein
MQDLVKWHGPYNQRPSTVCQHQLCQFCRQLKTGNRDPNKNIERKLKKAMHYKRCVPLLSPIENKGSDLYSNVRE